jgi:hypothetical protein
MRKVMTTSFRNLFLVAGFTAGTLLGHAILAPKASAQDVTSLTDYVSQDEPPLFDTPTAAVDAFKAALANNDFDGLAKLLGLDPVKLRTSEGVMDTFAKIREGVAKKLVVRDLDADRKVIDVGEELWPFPFPIAKGDDGKWAFDSYAGIEEIINRRVGENELQAIETVRAYVDAQQEYAEEDRDDDGVLEYAQKLISSEGQTDGLYWPADDVNGVSPAGDLVTDEALEKAKAGEGYFGYRYRILPGQGDQVAGGAYDYVINGNMIAGFGLVAWPVKYGETGVRTFIVNQQGIVYEADLGDGTEAKAAEIKLFNPDDSWEVTGD